MNDLISREAFRSSIQTVLNDTTCPIHIAAEIEEYLELEPAVDAVPVEWLEKHDSEGNEYGRRYINVVEALSMWQKEQEAR